MTKNKALSDKSYTVQLEPLHRSFQVPEGTHLIDVLHEYGVEFPCGGKGTCGGCKVRILEGNIPLDKEHRQALRDLGLSEEWRLSCMSRVSENVTLEVDQWKTIILADNTPFQFTPQEGYGIAVDVGTTTLVAQIIDLKEGKVLGAATATNPQSRYGADIMSRVEYAVKQDEKILTRLIREKVRELIAQLLFQHQPAVKKIVLVGNTVMHHLFCGIDLTPLDVDVPWFEVQYQVDIDGLRLDESQVLGAVDGVFQDPPGVALEGGVRRRVVDVTDQPGARDLGAVPPREDGERVRVRLQAHVRLLDADEAVDRGAVEVDPLGEGFLGLVGRDGDVFRCPQNVGELQPQEVDTLLLDLVEDALCLAR